MYLPTYLSQIEHLNMGNMLSKLFQKYRMMMHLPCVRYNVMIKKSGV